jgi:hypothetical protein
MRAIATTLCLSVLLMGCASTKQAKPTLPSYKPDPLPAPIEEREKSSLPKPSGNKPVAVAKDGTVPYSGILMDPYLAAKYKLIKAGRDRLRSLITTDRKAFSKSHAVTNEAFQEMAERAKRSWWENNKGTVGFWGGMIVGMALAILAVFGVDKAQSN